MPINRVRGYGASHAAECTGVYQVAAFLLVMLMVLAPAPSLHAASIQSQQETAGPGESITVDLTDFRPFEAILVGRFIVADSTQDPFSGTLIDRRIVTADGLGAYLDYTLTAPFEVSGGQLVLVAQGQQTGETAYSRISLSNVVLEMEITEEPCLDADAGELRVCARLWQICGDGSRVGLPGREVRLKVTKGDCSANVSGDDVLWYDDFPTDADGRVCALATGLSDTLLGQGVVVRAYFFGEDKPADNQPGNSACVAGERIRLSVAVGCYEVDNLKNCAGSNPGYVVTPTDSADVYFVRTIDIDRDNFQDIIYSGNRDSGLFIAFGQPDGSLTAPASFLTIAEAAVDVGYADGDTLLDIVAVTNGRLYVLLNEGSRTFAVDSLELPAGAGTVAVPSVAVGYFNGDDFLDIVTAPGYFLPGNGTGAFPTVLSLPQTCDIVTVGDLDRNQVDDLVLIADDSARAFVGLGDGTFMRQSAIGIGSPIFQVPPTAVSADLNGDGYADYAVVVPLQGTASRSRLTVALNDGLGNLTVETTIEVPGLAYNLSAADVNRDNLIDLVLVNGSTTEIEFYYGDGSGQYSLPEFLSLPGGTGATFALAALDINRDGNVDFVVGDLNGGALTTAVNQVLPPSPVIADEMVTVGFDNARVKVINPDGFVISETFRTVAGSDYQKLDFDGNGSLDQRTLDYNLQYGEYTIILEPSNLPPAGNRSAARALSAAIGIDGSQQATIFLGYGETSTNAAAAGDTVVFYYTVEAISSISPANGIPTDSSRPIYLWDNLIGGHTDGNKYQFQLDETLDFGSPRFDTAGIPLPIYRSRTSLGSDSVYYWRVRTIVNDVPQEWSRAFAVYVTGVDCFGNAGNIDNGTDGVVDIMDLTYFVEYFFNNGPGPLGSGQGNVNGDDQTDVVDLSYLVNYVLGNGPDPAACP